MKGLQRDGGAQDSRRAQLRWQVQAGDQQIWPGDPPEHSFRQLLALIPLDTGVVAHVRTGARARTRRAPLDEQGPCAGKTR